VGLARGASLELLLVDWLNDLCSASTWTSSSWPASRRGSSSSRRSGSSRAPRGEHLDPARHRVKLAVKGVTYHQLEIVKTDRDSRRRWCSISDDDVRPAARGLRSETRNRNPKPKPETRTRNPKPMTPHPFPRTPRCHTLAHPRAGACASTARLCGRPADRGHPPRSLPRAGAQRRAPAGSWARRSGCPTSTGLRFPIGGVAAMDTTTASSRPAGSATTSIEGPALGSGLSRTDVEPRLREIVAQMYRNVPTGVGSHRRDLTLSRRDLRGVLEQGRPGRRAGLRPPHELDCSRKRLPARRRRGRRVGPRLRARHTQLGTLGRATTSPNSSTSRRSTTRRPRPPLASSAIRSPS